jgi:molybdate transport system substrate-binding protein
MKNIKRLLDMLILIQQVDLWRDFKKNAPMRNVIKSMLLMLWCAPMAFAAPRELTNLTIITDPSLMLPIGELVRDYSTKHHVAVTLVSSEEKDPETLIGEGMEAHVLISADTELTKTLQLRGLVDVFIQNPLVRTDLTLVRRKIDNGSLSGQWTLANLFLNEGNAVPIFLLDPAHYMEGSRSIAVLNTNEVALDSRIVINWKRELIARLKAEDSAGILLASDALIDPDLQVVSILPAAQYEPIVFSALTLASEAMPEARKLVKFLNSTRAEATFSHYGFKPTEQ